MSEHRLTPSDLEMLAALARFEPASAAWLGSNVYGLRPGAPKRFPQAWCRPAGAALHRLAKKGLAREVMVGQGRDARLRWTRTAKGAAEEERRG